ncbi:hypothetical protein BD779DRAFT_722202 [Infundibulicybe gibba]|nr:hypothetical protein BD779DRAFT_722202 [Infundibulicybe gibba]
MFFMPFRCWFFTQFVGPSVRASCGFSYFLRTNSAAPFLRNSSQIQLKFRNSNSTLKITSPQNSGRPFYPAAEPAHTLVFLPPSSPLLRRGLSLITSRMMQES